jgi:hypothetical protein
MGRSDFYVRRHERQLTGYFGTTGEPGRLLLTGAVNFEFGTAGNLRPYLAGGAGVMRRTGTTPTARFLGSFQYSIFRTLILLKNAITSS